MSTQLGNPPAAPQVEPENRKSDPLLFTVGAIVSMAVAVWFGRALLQAIDAQSWTSTPCKITSFDATKTKKKYQLRVAYDYTFNGKQYAGKEYRISNDTTSDESVLARYQPGAESVCYVNPATPTQAVLDNGVGFKDYAYPIGAFVLSLGAGFFAIQSFKARKAGQLPVPDLAESQR